MLEFKFPVIPKSDTKSIRLPISMIEQVEKELMGKESSFTAFVREAVRCALELLEEQRNSSSDR